MFVPVPPGSDQPAPQPLDEPDEPVDIEDDAAQDEPPEIAIATLRGPMLWPAVVRWARLCGAMAYICLVVFGFLALRSVFLAIRGDPPLKQFVGGPPPVSPAVYLGEALLYVIYAVVSCISLLGFAQLLIVFLSIEAGVHRQRDRPSPVRERDDA
jgi:hypothetical protein